MTKQTIETVKENIGAANSIHSSITDLVTMDLEEYRAERSKVFNNRNLSQEGKQEQYKAIRKKYERQFLDLAKALKDTYHTHVKDAKEQAEKVMIAEVPKASDHKRKVFDQKAEALKAKVNFSLDLADAKKALEEIVSIADEPELAIEAKSQLMQLSQQVMSLTATDNELQSTKYELGEMYKRLAEKAMTEKAREASQLLEYMGRMESVTLFSPLVTGAIQEVSQDAAKYMNDPEKYLKSLEGGDEK
ncbi:MULTISPECIES: hypothetical protein [Priestia]|uniref:hypothetical protein n=1 Tax=Priestia TaxID=2800373 RepID=UPI002E1F99BA|nr:hypothetical protein [Priestia megaterium]